MSMETKVFFIGDVALDEYYSADYFPKLKEKIIVHSLPAQMGGMIANAACVYSSYGAKAAFFTALNDGPISRTLCKSLRDAGLDTRWMVWDQSLPDAKTIIIVAENEHTVFIPTLNLQRMEISDGAWEALSEADYLYSNFCELRPLMHRGQNCVELLRELKKNACKLWCDLDVGDIGVEDLALLALVDTLFLNERGFESLSRLMGGSLPERLFESGVKRLVVTLAEKGCIVYEEGQKPFSIDGIAVPVVDVTGAGDTFCSSFLYAWTKAADARLAARFANYAAARAVREFGPRAGAAGLEAVLDFIRAEGGAVDDFAPLLQVDEA